MKIGFAGSAPSETTDLATRLATLARDRGNAIGDAAEARLVFNLTRADEPAAHWTRRGLQQFGVTLLPLPGLSRDGSLAPASDILARAYPALLRTLSNAVVATEGGVAVLVTPEMGVRPIDGGGADLAAATHLALEQLATGDAFDERDEHHRRDRAEGRRTAQMDLERLSGRGHGTQVLVDGQVRADVRSGGGPR